MKTILSIVSLICFCTTLQAQTLTTTNLPIVIINTGGDEIPDEPKIQVSFRIIDNGTGTNHINDPATVYNGNCGIETRGNSTQGFEKKTYSIELWDAAGQDTSASLLGMGKEEDWILHAMVIDKTQLRIPMSFYLSQRMGHYAANWRYVEVMLDGDYQGLYILTEKIKKDDDRVDIATLDADDLAGDSLTGGYILRIDWLDDFEGFESNYNAQGGDPMFYQWYYPKAANIQPQQANYIEGWMGTFEDAVFAPNYANNQGIRYDAYIDLNSFTDFLLINELSKNADGYKLSSYLHKHKDNKGGLLHAGPIWDFDQTYGVSEVCSNYDPTGWTYLQNQPDCEDLESMPMWWQAMMEDEVFQNRLKCRWEMLRQGPLHLDSLYNWIEADTAYISAAKTRNFERWDFIGQGIWIEPQPIPQSYAEEITVMKEWLANRLIWMDANLPGDCSQDVNMILSMKEEQSSLLVFPNPAKDVLYIDQFGKSRLLTISNSLGQQVYQGKGKSIDVSQWEKGVYFVEQNGEVVKVVLD